MAVRRTSKSLVQWPLSANPDDNYSCLILVQTTGFLKLKFLSYLPRALSELVFFTIHNNGCNLLIHEDQNSCEQGKSDCQANCPRFVVLDWVDPPTSIGARWRKCARYVKFWRILKVVFAKFGTP